MKEVSAMKRRAFLQQSGVGLAMLGVSGLVLRSDANPTPRSLDAGEAENTLRLRADFDDQTKSDLKPTVARQLGPFYRGGSPFRAKLTPPFEPGTVLVVTGRVWSFETKKPLAGASLDLWQVDNQTRDYSSGTGGDFKNRARLLTTEDGYFEFETVHPVPYSPGANFWRSPHIHFIAAAAGHKKLVSEMFFKGDEKQDIDQLFHPALAVAVEKKKSNGKEYETAVFDIVLERG
jgi:protocatechuate 3,4-dioxygenase beta subunit